MSSGEVEAMQDLSQEALRNEAYRAGLLEGLRIGAGVAEDLAKEFGAYRDHFKQRDACREAAAAIIEARAKEMGGG